MPDASERTLDRVGAFAGVAAVVLLVSLFTVVPALPGPDAGIDEIAVKAATNDTALLFGSYLGALMAASLLVFGSALAAALRRAEGSGGGWWLVALAGIAATSIGVAGNVMAASFVRAVQHGVRGDADRGRGAAGEGDEPPAAAGSLAPAQRRRERGPEHQQRSGHQRTQV